MTILLRRITFLGLSHVSDSSESSYVAKDNMTFSCKLMGKSLEGLLHFWNCDLNDTVGYRWSGTFLRSEEFLSQFSDPNHIIGDWSVVYGAVVKFVLACGQVVSELPVWRRVVNESELCSADRSLCLPSGFLSTIPWFRGCRWIVIGWFVHPTQHSSLWSQFFVCRDRGKKQFYQFKVPVHKKTSEHLLLSVSQFFGEESSTVTVDRTVYFLYFPIIIS